MTDWRDMQYTSEQNRFHIQFSIGIIIIVILGLIGVAVFEDVTGFSMNVYTEIMSIGVTVFILDLRAEWREDRRREREIKEQLVRQAGSRSNETAKTAIDELWYRNWVQGEDSLLVKAHLKWANLAGAYLSDTNLAGAYLKYADFSGARLHRTNLQGAILTQSKFDGADMTNANVKGVDFSGASLKGVVWQDVEADSTTIMPDCSHWSVHTNMNRFIE